MLHCCTTRLDLLTYHDFSAQFEPHIIPEQLAPDGSHPQWAEVVAFCTWVGLPYVPFHFHAPAAAWAYVLR